MKKRSQAGFVQWFELQGVACEGDFFRVKMRNGKQDRAQNTSNADFVTSHLIVVLGGQIFIS